MKEEPPMVIFVMGLPGSGKSYFASRFAPAIQGVYLSSDLVRKEIFPQPQYSPAEKEAVYRALEARMQQAVQQGLPLVLDATFYQQSLRDRFEQAARAVGAQAHWIRVQAGENLTRKRVSVPRDHSDADWQVYLKLKAAYEPPRFPHLELSSDDEDVDRMIGEAIQYIWGDGKKFIIPKA
ncbi:MAG: ATP-binding protein [Bacteroidia bacterium]|nr:ATP-binding protein [Bacteroidia bacterium]